MSLAGKIVEGSVIKFSDTDYKVLGKATYSTRNEPDSIYIKVLLEGHHVLVIVPDEMIYFGVNKGRIPEFDSYGETVNYQGKQFKQVNHDHQIRLDLEFGSRTEVEGNVEFWDYEEGNIIISIAVNEWTHEREDVFAKYISFDDIVVA